MPVNPHQTTSHGRLVFWHVFYNKLNELRNFGIRSTSADIIFGDDDITKHGDGVVEITLSYCASSSGCLSRVKPAASELLAATFLSASDLQASNKAAVPKVPIAMALSDFLLSIFSI